MKSKKRKITKSNVEDANGIRISYHEKVCAERMKTLFKAIDEMKSDIKSLKEDMNRGKGAAAIIILIGGLIGSIFYFFQK
jgi:cytidine deaminase